MAISILAAFLGGIISLLSPCSALVLPSFFATTFHQRKKLLLNTLIFSLGILTVMIPLGLGLFSVLIFLNTYRHLITLVIGIFLVLEGLFQLTGRSLITFHLNSSIVKPKKNYFGATYSLGLASGIGAMSCVGPILGAIITLAANTPTIGGAMILLLAYTLGLVGPLLGLSLLWQKNSKKASSLLKGKLITLGSLKVHVVNIVAGLLFIFLGYVIIKYQGSLGTMPLFTHTGILNFTFDLQDKLFTL